MLRKRSFVFGAVLFCVGCLTYWYLPVHLVGSNTPIESLIDRLVSKNSPPEFPGDPPHFYFDEFLKNPGEWDADAQKPVSDAYYELKSMGKDAFPYLIKHFDDDRYSHERSYSTFVSHSVGDACRSIIEEQIDPRGMSYQSRKSPNGVVMGSEVLWEAYVKSKYGSYAAWWRSNRHSSVLTMRVKFCNWRIAKEKRHGFISDDQRARMSKSFERMLAEAKQKPDKMTLPPPDWYTIDAIVMDIDRVHRDENTE